MLTCRKAAVTGAIASGKSSVCQFLEELGAYVVDADDIVHRLLIPDTPIGKKVIHLLGTDIVNDGQLDRTKIAKKVFPNHELLWKLEQLLHPEVQSKIASLYKTVCSAGNYPLFVAEVPLLFETHAQDFYDWTIVVAADKKRSRQRFTVKTGYDGLEFDRRSARLIPLEEKSKLADFTVENNDSLDNLRAKVQTLYPKLLVRKREG